MTELFIISGGLAYICVLAENQFINIKKAKVLHMNYQQVKDPVWSDAEQTAIDCLVLFDNQNEFVPFTASPNDSTVYGPEIYAECIAGDYGPVLPYQPPSPPPPPPPPTAGQNKAKAMRLLTETDWVNQPDVYDPANTPHLLNRQDFLTYRAWVRNIAVNPVEGNLDWPAEPNAMWS